MTFSFATDARSQQFCEGIVRLMMILYHLSEAEALAIINRAWAGQDILGELNLVYHETVEYWAAVLANPNPYEQGTRVEQIAWQQRDVEARNRLAKLELQYPEFWRDHPDQWPALDS